MLGKPADLDLHCLDKQTDLDPLSFLLGLAW